VSFPLEPYCSASRALMPKVLLAARARVGEIELAAVDVAAGPGSHAIARIPNTEAVLLVVEDQGCHECVTVQDGREARLRVGDFTLCETTRPYEVYAAGPCRMLIAGIPRALLQRYVPCPEEVTAVPMSARESLNGLVSDCLRSLWTRFADGCPLSDAWQVSQATLSLVASAYASLPRAKPTRRSAATAHRARIRTYVERYLTDPDLTPTTIARACQINLRYMHRLYAREDETLGQYILRRRLEEGARALRSANRGRSVTEIAFAFGFKSATHFGRAFRERYHLTPGKYRMIR
jgi:AraC family transcriptional regulator, positive regulator of tynA and feaB